jgi:predicted nucleotidyltransferase
MPSRTVNEIPAEALRQYYPFRTPSKPALPELHKSALDVSKSLANSLKVRFSATKVVLFGSVLRSDFTQWSDIDLAVWGISASDYFKAVAYVSGYSNIFKIDLIDAEDCSPSLLRHIEQYGVEL